MIVLRQLKLHRFVLNDYSGSLRNKYDMFQTQHTILRNFPLFGRGRWIMETLRPYIFQYFVESDTDGAAINRLTQAKLQWEK